MSAVLSSYGCYNRKPFKEVVVLHEGHDVDVVDGVISRIPVKVEMPFTMSKDCNYTHTALGQADKKCFGCSWREKPQAHAEA